jgi:inosose dehydratase
MVAWPGIRAGFPAAAGLGFGAAEVFALAVWANDPDDVAAWLGDAGLALSAVYVDLPADPAEAAATADRAARAAATLAAATAGNDPRLVVTAAGADLDRAVAVLSAAGAASAATGVRLCVHPHQGTAVESRAQTDAVLAATDPDHVWVCADTGHLLAAGDDPAAAIAAWASRLAAVHLKDVDAAGRVVAAGAGRLPLTGTLAAIDSAVTAGAPVEHLTIEIEGMANPGPALRASAAAVRLAAPVTGARS